MGHVKSLYHSAQHLPQTLGCYLYYKGIYENRQIPTCNFYIYFKNGLWSPNHCHL